MSAGDDNKPGEELLEDLWQAARLVVPGLPEDVLLEMDSADLNALSRVGIAPYWLLSFVLVGICTAVVISITLPQGLLLLCIPRILTVALLYIIGLAGSFPVVTWRLTNVRVE
ncbi:hypothetical protein CKAH01_16809 [Colletotrichum kahawae]|uniref:Uncharacterized protein n=1 Tax=Colletotrichum kahawae TaxID=34407 RepID=A0AAD9YD53_COLKA|nr:hypothetical protein CKAH01_16809 [Colletotrichum kahawae]